MSEKMQGREVIFEYMPVGQIMRVTAMDTATMTEVVFQAPLSTPEAALQKTALLKLEYVLRKAGKIT